MLRMQDMNYEFFANAQVHVYLFTDQQVHVYKTKQRVL